MAEARIMYLRADQVAVSEALLALEKEENPSISKKLEKVSQWNPQTMLELLSFRLAASCQQAMWHSLVLRYTTLGKIQF